MTGLDLIDDPFATLVEKTGAASGSSPVLTPLAKQMKVDLVVSPESRIWLLHDRYFDELIAWAEYDIDMATLCLVTHDGRMQPLGMKIHQPLRKYMQNGRQLYTMLVKDKKIVDSYILPLLVRDTGYYQNMKSGKR